MNNTGQSVRGRNIHLGWKMDPSHLEDSTEKKYNIKVNTRGTIKVQVIETQPVLMYNQ